MSAEFQGHPLDARYLAFFKLFNDQLFFEAHEVLEDLWLERKDENYAFYKGLIQLAGAFVHLQKDRLKPAAALLRLATANLRDYPLLHQQLDTVDTLLIINGWLLLLEESAFRKNPLASEPPPKLVLAACS